VVHPVVMKGGRDVLFATDAEKAAFVPQIDITHQMIQQHLAAEASDVDVVELSGEQAQQREDAADKGLAAKYRMYEVRSISHSGGENLRDANPGAIEILDLSKMMDRFIDLLDAWWTKASRRRRHAPTGPNWATSTATAVSKTRAGVSRSRLLAGRLLQLSRIDVGDNGVRQRSRPGDRAARREERLRRHASRNGAVGLSRNANRGRAASRSTAEAGDADRGKRTSRACRRRRAPSQGRVSFRIGPPRGTPNARKTVRLIDEERNRAQSDRHDQQDERRQREPLIDRHVPHVDASDQDALLERINRP